MGKFKMNIVDDGYCTIEPYNNMWEHCPSEPPSYSRPAGCWKLPNNKFNNIYNKTNKSYNNYNSIKVEISSYTLLKELTNYINRNKRINKFNTKYLNCLILRDFK